MTLYRRNGILLFVVGLVLLQVTRYVTGLPPEPGGPLRDLFMAFGILCPLVGGLACMAVVGRCGQDGHTRAPEVRTARKEAAAKLLDAVKSELGVVDFHVGEDDGRVFIGQPFGRGAFVLVSVDGTVRVAVQHGNGFEDVPLQFNPHTNMLEGTEPDAYINQVPGEPVQMRSALAVVVECVLDRMREERNGQ